MPDLNLEGHAIVQRGHINAVVGLFDAGVGIVVVTCADFRAIVEAQADTQSILELELAAKILIDQIGCGEVGRADAAFHKGGDTAITGAETQPEHRRQAQAGGIQTTPASDTCIPVAIQPDTAGVALPQCAPELELGTQTIGGGTLGGLTDLHGNAIQRMGRRHQQH